MCQIESRISTDCLGSAGHLRFRQSSKSFYFGVGYNKCDKIEILVQRFIITPVPISAFLHCGHLDWEVCSIERKASQSPGYIPLPCIGNSHIEVQRILGIVPCILWRKVVSNACSWHFGNEFLRTENLWCTLGPALLSFVQRLSCFEG